MRRARGCGWPANKELCGESWYGILPAERCDRSRRKGRNFVPESEIVLIARAVIAAHGAEALAVAERSAANVRRLGMDDRVKWWARVAAAIKEIEASASR